MPEVRLGVRKEMRALDVLFVESSRNFYSIRMGDLEKDIARARHNRPKVVGGMERKLERYRKAQAVACSLDAYLAYWRDRAADGPEVLAVADLTPTYALLEASHWEQVREGVRASGFEPRVLFLMRDPISRIESAWRMYARSETERSERTGGVVARAAVRGAAIARDVAARVLPQGRGGGLLDFASQGTNLRLSQYEATIAAVEAAFPREEVMFEFYETLFRQETVDRIMAFAGLPSPPADFEARVNASPLRRPVAPREIDALRERLDPTYRFCADRFGAERIGAIWKHARLAAAAS